MMQTTTAKPIKVYVAVKTDFAADGTMLPREITWEDGQRFEIDRILDIRQAASFVQRCFGDDGSGTTERTGLHFPGRFFHLIIPFFRL